MRKVIIFLSLFVKIRRIEQDSSTEEPRSFLKRGGSCSSVIAPEAVEMALMIGSIVFFIHCLRKVKQNQGSLKTALQLQNQTSTETSSLSFC